MTGYDSTQEIINFFIDYPSKKVFYALTTKSMSELKNPPPESELRWLNYPATAFL